MPWIQRDAMRKANGDSILMYDYLRDAEDELRESLGMYKIGQKWINETIVYNIVKDFLGEDYEVIQHARPSYLNGLEYDVYVPHLKLAIEYDGAQHHEAVSIFGGEEGLKKTKARDERKNSLSLENGICLIRLNPDYSKEELFARLRQILSDNEEHEIHVNKHPSKSKDWC